MGTSKRDDNPANRDPITGAPGSHPVGTAAGATSGGVAGAVVGTAGGGPVGGAVGGGGGAGGGRGGGAGGAAVGAVAGGRAGHAAGEAVNPSVEDIYWRQAHIREPYYRKDFTYDDYGPAYRTGYEGASRYHGQNRRLDDVEPELRGGHQRLQGKSRFAWEDAKAAARAAWDRVERALPGDVDDDGREGPVHAHQAARRTPAGGGA